MCADHRLSGRNLASRHADPEQCRHLAQLSASAKMPHGLADRLRLCGWSSVDLRAAVVVNQILRVPEHGHRIPVGN